VADCFLNATSDHLLFQFVAYSSCLLFPDKFFEVGFSFGYLGGLGLESVLPDGRLCPHGWLAVGWRWAGAGLAVSGLMAQYRSVVGGRDFVAS
jgi:hypothetical protein